MELNQLNNQPPSNEEAVVELLTLTCEVNKWGDKRYYNKEGELHRIHGPAIVYENGTEFWYKNDELHREDGPAYISSSHDGPKFYYIDGHDLTKSQFIRWQIKNGIKPIE